MNKKLFNQKKVGNRTHYKQVVADVILRRQATLQDSTCENTVWKLPNTTQSFILNCAFNFGPSSQSVIN